MSKVIGKDQSADCESWILPSFSDGSNSGHAGVLTASQIEKLQKQAYDEAHAEGFQKGLEEGLAAAAEQLQVRLDVLNGLVDSLAKPFTDLDSQIDEELIVLVQALVKQMVRRELKTEPGQIMAVIREAIESLPVASRRLQLRLHPQDAALVNEFYALGDKDLSWDIVEDPLISRGGCKVITDVTQVDATLETRLNQLFAHVFGERQQDQEEATKESDRGSE
jgi:flagellar assembly protein FliH